MNFLSVLALKLPEATLENDVVSKKDDAPLPKEEKKDALPKESKKGKQIQIYVCHYTHRSHRSGRCSSLIAK